MVPFILYSKGDYNPILIIKAPTFGFGVSGEGGRSLKLPRPWNVHSGLRVLGFLGF